MYIKVVYLNNNLIICFKFYYMIYRIEFYLQYPSTYQLKVI